MGTLIEEIFSHKLGRTVTQGETVIVEVDHVMSHDTTTPLAIQAFRKLAPQTGGRVFNSKRSHIVFDHIIPAATVAAATLQRDIRTFAREQDITILQEGICHQVMPERGFVVPGDIIVGADSHTCTYGALGAFATGMGVYAKDVTFEMVRRIGVDGANYCALEYSGELVEQFSVSQRFTFCNMAIEMGGKAGLVTPDATTQEWLRGRTDRTYPMLAPRNPQYKQVVTIDASRLEPMIACPPDVNNVVPVADVEDIQIDQVFLGTCTNGRLDDLAIAAGIMQGKTLHPQTRMVVVPASREVYLEAMRRGYLETFVQAGASVENPGCGPCIGRHQGVLAPGERAATSPDAWVTPLPKFTSVVPQPLPLRP